MTMPSESREDRRQRVEDALGMIDPRASREAAWQAIERGLFDLSAVGEGASSCPSVLDDPHRRFRQR